ncbi:DNA polymerase III, subunit gamma and tau [Candidatus Roizmanbacteria bacterium RIFCSPLOWO2_02_FULL_37_19]|uniref:DNA polymerase III subunit gamma/tau n=1 Tax=Candidatus Roizmanbacteria bacterium RIFCSPHIGHO2_02_FULL_37_24 TaxID=1802037 RepID=A0A1F7GVW0_9BACT|nr:MAG: DNA polymerase III, subunit gamma and tau [Candidatus Roizmanbacteria bacterium RIFCSPHIGHO2_01_FULL_38_41]OGK22955.1 MAG: DNA polymerase III, subunit gamma and tau [Candidatus Roizmanbacteria bacterium RIFCSPHIGHO2_02_FULL_37_24]OGK33591.1 MAG: DNA polymerase III, subunit gamma and tau [Candidatus Roizmanbacteria bacterium RIFCSPHIGHO2_12_FULL_37_23]OGK44204.1 MAG: DNA polymerase III, subunit gamma and tau [Candidatus Roizmanbacteria bacterium RIFCSPLOWO2_01_FULL_37_57]OGK55243.1 MAG: 
MFYLKYRPQSIKELDSKSVRDQLIAILKASNIPHAFLFTGPKGTGKTSTARILAKVLNCEENIKKLKTLTPSLTDKNVSAITKGISPDVIEMDAASNRKIDDIRLLISDLKFMPLTSRYKIYIIDEVHMLTKEAFNALLKSLEEPPESTVFILATTEAGKLPKTIISRCIQINFSKAKREDIISMLDRISTSEKIKLTHESKTYIADSADGSFRDAAKILELAVIQNDTNLDGIKKILGHSWVKGDLLDFLSKKNAVEALKWLENSAEHGTDFKLLIESLLQSLHQQLLIKNRIEVHPQTEYNFRIKDIARLIQLFQKAYNQLKFSPIEALPLEIAVIEYLGEENDLN